MVDQITCTIEQLGPPDWGSERTKKSSAFVCGYRYSMRHGRKDLTPAQVQQLHPEYDLPCADAFRQGSIDAAARDDFRYNLALGNLGIPAV